MQVRARNITFNITQPQSVFRCGFDFQEETLSVLSLLNLLKLENENYYFELLPAELASSHSFPALTRAELAKPAPEKKVFKKSGLGIYSSGTTGTPKLFTKDGAQIFSAKKVKSEIPQTWILSYLPYRWAGIAVLAHAITNDCALVIPQSLALKDFLKAALDYSVTAMSLTPSYFRKILLSQELTDMASQIKLSQLTFGGEVCTQSTLDAAKSLWPGCRVSHVYASTDHGNLWSVSDGLEGAPAKNFARADFSFTENQLKIKGVATGDFWILDANKNRYIFTGRAEDMVNIGGEKVSLLEVEKLALLAPQVKAVQAFKIPNSLMGNLVGIRFVGDCTESELRRWFAEQVPQKILRPAQYKKVEDLELTNAGKAKKYE